MAEPRDELARQAERRAEELLQRILADLESRSVRATALNVLCAATDLGADDKLAAKVAALAEARSST